MLVRERRTSSANGAFSRNERQDNAGMISTHGSVATTMEGA
jgi:hypothetical protein